VEVITVCDREADIYELFAFAQKRQAPLLVRASSDRALLDAKGRKLWPQVEGQPVARHLTVNLPGNDQRPERQATVSVRFACVSLRPPWRPSGLKLPAVTLNAVLVWEENPPADIDEPIEWLLLTNTPVTSFEEAYRGIGWYCGRWQIEVFHKVPKSGCRVETCRCKQVVSVRNNSYNKQDDIRGEKAELHVQDTCPDWLDNPDQKSPDGNNQDQDDCVDQRWLEMLPGRNWSADNETRHPVDQRKDKERHRKPHHPGARKKAVNVKTGIFIAEFYKLNERRYNGER
jgi:hypothetical protein